jgi:hypothetical protein
VVLVHSLCGQQQQEDKQQRARLAPASVCMSHSSMRPHQRQAVV